MLRATLATVATLTVLAGPTLALADEIRMETYDAAGRMQSQNNLKQIGLAATLKSCQGAQGPGRTTVSGPEIPTSRSLAAAVSGRQTLARAKLFGRKAGGDSSYVIELQDILITSAQPATPTGGLPQTLTVSYAAMSWTVQGPGCGR